MTACMVPTCTEKATHHLAGGPEDVRLDACDVHFTAMRPLLPHADEQVMPSERVLADVVGSVIFMRANLDGIDLDPHQADVMALHILRQLTVPHSSTLELMRRYIEERHE